MFALLLGMSMFGVQLQILMIILNGSTLVLRVYSRLCGFLLQSERVFFKQKNIDGTLGSVCSY